jgi:hypothetical protein
VNLSIPQKITIDGVSINTTAPGVASVVTGQTGTSMRFTGTKSINFTVGNAGGSVSSDGGNNTWVVGNARIAITGGSGADAYVFHAHDRRMTINDFSAAKGDTLTVDQSPRSAVAERSDGHGGSLLTFGTGTGSIDIRNIASFPVSSIRFA